MASRTWKCVPCGKAFKTSQPRTVGPKCPGCGTPLSAAPDGNPPRRFPTPQPRAVPRQEATPAPARRRPAGRAAVVNRHPSPARPSDPAQALAGLSSSSPWTPDPDVGLSPDARDIYAKALLAPLTPAKPAAKVRPEWLKSASSWAAAGGVSVAILFSLVFFLTRHRLGSTRAAGAPNAPIVHDNPGNAIAAAATAVSQPSVPLRTVDLFPYLDPARDTVGGSWRVEGNAVMSDASHRARLGIRYPVPREYDFRIQFTQVDGDNCATQIFTAGRSASFVLGAYKRTVTGFQQIAGKWVNANETGVRGIKFENGRMHTSVVKVRKDSIEAWLDGARITSYATDGSDLSNRDWELPGYAIGLGSELSSTIFHKVELVEFGPPAATEAH